MENRALPFTVEQFNQRGATCLPGHLGIEITHVERNEVRASMHVQDHAMAPNGFLHAGALVTLADTCAGYGCVLNLPDGATGFTTVELKSNHLGTARGGHVLCSASPMHVGTTTQVWDAVVRHAQTLKVLALFRCTQMVLYAKPGREGPSSKW
jgi:1,4-dihydroxy-2-naphthoyl-CoA hydrolase